MFVTGGNVYMTATLRWEEIEYMKSDKGKGDCVMWTRVVIQ